MRVFEVFRNNERLSAAGLQGDAVLSVIVTSVQINDRDELNLDVSGLDSATGERVSWTQIELKAGDEVRIKIAESESADQPETRAPRNREKELQAQQDYVREMAKSLGWTVNEHPA